MLNLSDIQKKYKISPYKLNKLLLSHNIQPVKTEDREMEDMVSFTTYTVTVKYFDEDVIDKLFN